MEQFSCKICAQKFMQRAALLSHVSICELFIDHIRNSPEEELLSEENEENEIESENKCHVCGLKLKTKNTLQNHIKKVHDGKKKHKCNICNTVLSTNQYLKRHIERVHDEIFTLFPCKLCAKTLKSKQSLDHHISSVHEGKKAT